MLGPGTPEVSKQKPVRGPSCPPRAVRSRAGFTILELATTMMALSLLAAVTIPAWFGRSSITLDNAARLLARDLRDVQNLAARRGEVLRIRFLEDGDGYQVVDALDRELPAPLGGGPYRRWYSIDAVFTGVSVISADFDGQRSACFDEHGYALSGGEVVLLYRGQTRRLQVVPRTGLVEIEGLAQRWIDTGH